MKKKLLMVGKATDENLLGVIIKIYKITDNRGLGTPPEHWYSGVVYENEEETLRGTATNKTVFSGESLKETKESASKKIIELFGGSGNINWE